MKKIFCIQHINNPKLYWSDECGWVELDLENEDNNANLSLYSEDMIPQYHTPAWGKWVLYAEVTDLHEPKETGRQIVIGLIDDILAEFDGECQILFSLDRLREMRELLLKD